MKGSDLYKRVLNLLGYLNNDDSIASDMALYKRAIHAFNQILLDLNEKEITDLNCEIDIPQKNREALIYGVAMILSLTSGDSERNRLFADIYNAKRSAALSSTDKVSDVLPITFGGEI